MRTLLLDRSRWDLVLDSGGNIAVASNPYSLAQDAASAIRLFKGELWYDTTKGVPYFAQILGLKPPLSLMKARFIAAAMTVPEVVKSACFIRSIDKREVSGQVQITDNTGTTIGVGF